jgi:hypothetical protein
MLKLPGHSRYAYSPIVERKDYSWPQGKRLAFYVALNIEHFVSSNRGNGQHFVVATVSGLSRTRTPECITRLASICRNGVILSHVGRCP